LDLLYGLYLSSTSGIFYGLVIALLAVGMSLIYGIMGNINIAHGSFYMVGAYAAFAGSVMLGLQSGIADVFGIAFATLLGMLVFYFVIPSRVKVAFDSRSQNRFMILTLGVAYILQEVVSLEFAGQGAPVRELLSGTILLPGSLYITYQESLSALISILTFAFLYIFLYRTKTGRGLRAFSQDRETAEAMGVNVVRIATLTFGIATAMAALSGVLQASMYSITPDSAFNGLITAFIIVTFGGIGSVTGTLIAGLLYGVIYSVIQFFLPLYSFIVVVIAIYLLLVLRPSGLLGKIVERA